MEIILHQLHKEVIQKLLESFSAQEARFLADRVFEHYLKLSSVNRVLQKDTIIDSGNVSLIIKAVDKLLMNMPIQYVTGKGWFLNLEMEVSSAVLIPRPETEELVNQILDSIKLSKQEKQLRILDIGTGSGCIAIALKHYNPDLNITAIDISSEALHIAKTNALKHKTHIAFKQLNILNVSEWEDLGEFDLIVSNPPYVTEADKAQMQPNVLDFEPHVALFVPDTDPLLFYKKIVGFAKLNLADGGSLWFEINEHFGEEAKAYIENEGFRIVNIFTDFREKIRFLHVVK